MYKYRIARSRKAAARTDAQRASLIKAAGGSMLACAIAIGLSACGLADGSESLVQDANAETRIAVNTQSESVRASKPGGATTTTQSSTNTTSPASTTSKSTGVVNSVDAIVGDMTLENDAKLDGIPNFLWATGPHPAAVLMGADPRGCKMHSWWLNMSAVKADYKDCDLWTTYIQWFIIFEGVGNAGYNVRVETRQPKSYYLSKSTGKWALLGQHASTSWFLASKSNLTYVSGTVDKRTSTDGSVAVKVPVGASHAYHGVWPLGKIDISSVVGDMAALYTTVQARLVVDDPNGPDDRSKAVLLMHSGADYYPNMNATAADSFPPSAGLSRSKRITSEWQAFNFATISGARQDYVGASASIATESFRANPPPLD